jgi:hypothetical protein
MIDTILSAFAALAVGAPPLIFPSQAPRLPAAIDAKAAEGFTACAYWRDPNHRPIPSPEAVTLKGAYGVSRAGRRLKVGGHVFTDERGEQEMDQVDHRYAGRLTGLAHLVYKRPYEGHAWLLVADGLAEPIDLPGVPVASPKGHALAAAAEDPVFRQSGVVIVEHRMEGMAIGAEISEAGWPCDLHWISEDELSLKVSVGEPGEGRWAPASIRREAGRWIYHPPVGQ